MEWTGEFKEEMKQRHLRQIKIYAILVIFSTVVLVPTTWYMIKFRQFGFGESFGYISLIAGAYVYSAMFMFYLLFKKTPWIRFTSWLILLSDSIGLTLIIYVAGAPHFNVVAIYPVVIVIYSIYLHPELATRFCVLAMAFLGIETLLLYWDLIPFFPSWQSNSEIHSIINSLVYSTDYQLFFFVAYGVVTAISFSTLIVVNTIVKETREKSELISRLSEKLKVYLPHQFVASLAKGDRDSHPDYKRRRLTVFFSDVRGFTNWTDKLEPEEVREVLNQYLTEMNAIANKHGGTIDKFIGDAIMIFFGDPEYTDDKDHALRCVRMAMEMQDRMAELRKDWRDIGYEEPLHIRVGINTGYATVGNFGSEDRLNYTALGSAVNLASRLETACTPDRITISHTTYSLIKNEIACEAKGEIEVKGFSEPVKIYEVR